MLWHFWYPSGWDNATRHICWPTHCLNLKNSVLWFRKETYVAIETDLSHDCSSWTVSKDCAGGKSFSADSSLWTQQNNNVLSKFSKLRVTCRVGFILPFSFNRKSSQLPYVHWGCSIQILLEVASSQISMFGIASCSKSQFTQ